MRAFELNTHRKNHLQKVSLASIFIFAGVLALLSWMKLRPFFSGHFAARERYYFNGTPENRHNGYTGKVNELLNRYIKAHGLDQFELNRLVGFKDNNEFTIGDGVFSFYLPDDGDITGLRLIGINKFDTAEDSLFYYNSKLPEHLQLQRLFPDRRIFDTRFQSRERNKFLSLKSIALDENILSVPLISNTMFWKDDVRGRSDSLFAGFIFLKMAKAWLPIGRSYVDKKVSDNYAYGQTDTIGVNFYTEHDQFNLARKMLLEGKRSIYLNFGENKNIKITDIADTLYLNATGIGDIEMLYPHRVVRLFQRSRNNYIVPVGQTDFEFRFKDLSSKNIGTIFCTKENPFDNFSYVVYHNNSNFRYALAANEADLFSGILARNIPEIENVFSEPGHRNETATASLTINPFISKFLSNHLTAYLDSNSNMTPYWRSKNADSSARIGITLMNTATAEVIAAPWLDKAQVHHKNYKDLVNYNFLNHPIGSCFKPLLLLASYVRYPSLYKLKLIPGMTGNIADFGHRKPQELMIDTRILNYPTKGFYGDSKGYDDLNVALARSSNLYPVIDLLYALVQNSPSVDDQIMKGPPFPTSLYDGHQTNSVALNIITGQLYGNRLTETNLPAIFSRLYNVEDRDILKNGRDLFDYNYWDSRYLVSYDALTKIIPPKKLENYAYLCPDRVSLNFDAFANDGKGGPNGNFRMDVVPWVLGSQNNRWNNMKLCEAFCRLVTGRAVRGTFIHEAHPNIALPLIDMFRGIKKQQFGEAQIALLQALNSRLNPQQTLEGTWKEQAKMINDLNVEGVGHDFVLLAKTGTAQDEESDNNKNVTRRTAKKRVHRGAFMFTLMTRTQFQRLTDYIKNGFQPSQIPKQLGITGVISLELTDQGKQSPLIYSKFAREFLMDNHQFIGNLVRLNRKAFE